jgi:hypothetical protein
MGAIIDPRSRGQSRLVRELGAELVCSLGGFRHRVHDEHRQDGRAARGVDELFGAGDPDQRVADADVVVFDADVVVEVGESPLLPQRARTPDPDAFTLQIARFQGTVGVAMIAILDPSQADAVIVGEGDAPVVAVLLSRVKADVRTAVPKGRGR